MGLEEFRLPKRTMSGVMASLERYDARPCSVLAEVPGDNFRASHQLRRSPLCVGTDTKTADELTTEMRDTCTPPCGGLAATATDNMWGDRFITSSQSRGIGIWSLTCLRESSI